MWTPIRGARRDLVAREIENLGGRMLLDKETFRTLKRKGLNRTTVETAIDDLVDTGLATLEPTSLGVRVRLKPPGQ